MDMLEVSRPVFFAVTGLMFLIIGIGKGGLGGTLGTIATPVMALLLPASTALAFVLPILIAADWFSVYFYWRQWNLRIVLLLLPGCLLGITIGTFFISNAPTNTIALVLGIVVLVAATYQGFIDPIVRKATKKAYEERFWHAGVAGTIGGFSSALAASGTPPIIIYLLYRDDLEPRTLLATMVLLFTILNMVKVPYYFAIDLFDFSLYPPIIFLLPLVPLGVWLGQWLVNFVDREVFNKILVGLLFFLGILLIVRSTGLLG